MIAGGGFLSGSDVPPRGALEMPLAALRARAQQLHRMTASALRDVSLHCFSLFLFRRGAVRWGSLVGLTHG